MAKYYKSKIKKGLGLICFSIVVTFLMSLVYAIVKLVKKGNPLPNALTITNSVVLIICAVLIVLGAIICLLSGQKHFRKALITYIVLVIWLVVVAILENKITLPSWLPIIEIVLLCLAHVSILLALKEVTNNVFNIIIMTVCLLAYLTSLILAIVYCVKPADIYVNVIKILIIVEDVAFFVGIFTTYLSLRKTVE